MIPSASVAVMDTISYRLVSLWRGPDSERKARDTASAIRRNCEAQKRPLPKSIRITVSDADGVRDIFA